MSTINVQTVVYRESKYWVAQCLNIDVSSFGGSEDEALKNLQEALELYLEDEDRSEIGEVSRPEIKGLSLQGAEGILLP